MFEQVGEALGPDRRLQRPGRTDLTGDQRQLALDRDSEPPGAIVDQWIEPTDRSIEALDRRGERPFPSLSVLIEGDHARHGPNDSPGV